MGIDIENHSVFQKNKMIVIQLNDTRPSNRKRNKNNKNKNEKSSIITVISNGTITLRRKAT
jgi:hypothetical protein